MLDRPGPPPPIGCMGGGGTPAVPGGGIMPISAASRWPVTAEAPCL